MAILAMPDRLQDEFMRAIYDAFDEKIVEPIVASVAIAKKALDELEYEKAQEVELKNQEKYLAESKKENLKNYWRARAEIEEGSLGF